MYFTIMNLICFGVIGYLLLMNGIEVTRFSYWAILALVIVVQLLPIVCFMSTDNDNK